MVYVKRFWTVDYNGLSMACPESSNNEGGNCHA